MNVDQQIIKALSSALDALVGACLNADGQPKAPDRRALMQARASLPAYCQHAFKEQKVSPAATKSPESSVLYRDAAQ